MNPNAKNEAVRGLKTEVLEYILSHLGGNEVEKKSPEYPLGGLVHIDGVGQVSVERLRAELDSRHSS